MGRKRSAWLSYGLSEAGRRDVDERLSLARDDIIREKGAAWFKTNRLQVVQSLRKEAFKALSKQEQKKWLANDEVPDFTDPKVK